METLGLISLVGLFGYYLKDQNPRSKENIRNVSELNDPVNSMPEIERPQGTNIYTSDMVNAANDEVLRLSQKNYKDSQNPGLSGILPPIYNSYSVTGNPNILQSSKEEESTLKILTEMNNTNRYKNVLAQPMSKIEDRPIFNPVYSNDIKQVPFSNFGQNPINVNISLLTGLPIETGHDNQVPFFGSSITQNVETFKNESKLDNFTGNTSTFFHKKEQIERFDPSMSKETGINGSTRTPAISDIERDRFIPSNFRESEKPFYPEQISAPIAATLNNPVYNAAASFPTIDEMRTANQKQISYPGLVKSGKDPITTRGDIGKMSYKIDTSFELGNQRWNKTTGAHLNNKSTENYTNMTPTARQTQNLEYYGGAEKTNAPIQRLCSVDNSNELCALFTETTKNQVNVSHTRNVNSIQSNPNINTNGLGSDTYNFPELQRDSTKEYQLTNINKASIGPRTKIQDNAKQTNKQTILTDRSGSGTINSTFFKDSNTTDIGTDYTFKMTQKENLVDNKYLAQANKKDGMGYNIVNMDAKTTNKETTLAKNYVGSGNFTNEAENREQYDNVYIRDTKEKSLMGEHARGKNSGLNNIYAGIGALGAVKSTDNQLLKESANKRTENVDNINSIITNKMLIGQNTQLNKGDNSQIDLFNNNNTSARNNRFDADVITEQLSKNIYYNLN